MRTVIFVLVVLVLLLVALGFYREWFHIGTTSNPEGGQSGIQVTVDKEKVKADVDTARQQVRPSKAEAATNP